MPQRIDPINSPFRQFAGMYWKDSAMIPAKKDWLNELNNTTAVWNPGTDFESTERYLTTSEAREVLDQAGFWICPVCEKHIGLGALHCPDHEDEMTPLSVVGSLVARALEMHGIGRDHGSEDSPHVGDVILDLLCMELNIPVGVAWLSSREVEES